VLLEKLDTNVGRWVYSYLDSWRYLEALSREALESFAQELRVRDFATQLFMRAGDGVVEVGEFIGALERERRVRGRD